MKNVVLPLPSFVFVVTTRAALAAGIGLLLANRLPAVRRGRLGRTLVAIGAATTVPAAMSVMRSISSSQRASAGSHVHRDKRLIGATRFPRKGDDEI
jgi:hypothetical protein